MPEIRKFEKLTKYNQQNHVVEMYLDNSGGESDERRYPINPNSIVSLVIETDLSGWVTSGTLSFYYDPSVFVGGIDQNTGQDTRHSQATITKNTNPATYTKNAKMTPEQSGSYTFRNDGNDLLRIKITPASENQSNLKTGYSIDSADKFWTLSYVFSIYDVEDVDMPPGSSGAASANIKCLKLHFYDIRYQALNSEIIEYSTSQSPIALKTTLSEKDHSIPTGIAIKEILEKGLLNTNKLFVKQATGSGENEWEDGATSIFFTSPTQATCLDCVNYLYNYHSSGAKGAYSALGRSPRGGGAASSINDFSLLTIERGPTAADIGYFTLRPVSWYFSQAGNQKDAPGEYQIEHFFLQGYSGQTSTTSGTPAYKTLRAPILDSNEKKDIKTGRHNLITNYRFVDMSALVNSNIFRTRPVYSFDFANRKMNVEFQQNNVKKARQFISQQYINKVYRNTQNNPEELFLITLEKAKNDLSLTPVFSLYGEDSILRQCDGIKKLLYTGLFQNTCINFRAPGLTSRQVGRFVAIDRTEGVESTPFNDKFYGQWFIISIKHVFEGELYYNDITAVKVHRFNKLPVEFLGTVDNFS
jgi:hypothetical protein